MDGAEPLDELHREIDELRASRRRVVLEADDERRRIERGLHDGIQQHLVALAVNLQLARDLADGDPSGLRALLRQMGQDVRDALDSVRELAQRVYPPLLLDRGVAEALRGAAAGLGIPVKVEALAERYPPDVEAAVFFCCLDALQDAGPGGPATVRVWPEAEMLRFEVCLRPAEKALPSERVLTAMGDRLGAVCGRLSVSSDGGQTSIIGTVRLEP